MNSKQEILETYGTVINDGTSRYLETIHGGAFDSAYYGPVYDNEMLVDAMLSDIRVKMWHLVYWKGKVSQSDPWGERDISTPTS